MSRSRARRVCDTRFGFTLIELIVVCAILTILSTVTIAAFERFQSRSDDRQHTASLANQLEQCRQLAVRYDETMHLSVDSSSRSTWLGVPQADHSEWIKTAMGDTDLALKSARATFSCSPTGAIFGPVSLPRRQGDSAILLIDPPAGRVATWQ